MVVRDHDATVVSRLDRARLRGGALFPTGEVPEPGAGQPALDIVSEVELEFAEAVHGVVVSLSVQRESVCTACGGEQISPAADDDSCEGCERDT